METDEKSPCSPKGTRTEKTISAVPPCLPKNGHSSRCHYTGCPITLALRQKILWRTISPCPRRPICCSAFRFPLSCGKLSVDAPAALLPRHWFAVKLCFLYNTPAGLSRKIFPRRTYCPSIGPGADSPRPCFAPFPPYKCGGRGTILGRYVAPFNGVSPLRPALGGGPPPLKGRLPCRYTVPFNRGIAPQAFPTVTTPVCALVRNDVVDSTGSQ